MLLNRKISVIKPFKRMAENQQINENLRTALCNIAQEARNLLDNFDDRNCSVIERQLMQSTTTTLQPIQEGTRERNVTAVSTNANNITKNQSRNRHDSSGLSHPSISSILMNGPVNRSSTSNAIMHVPRGQRRSEDVPQALRRSFPTLASKSSSKSVKKTPAKKARKCNIVHKDVILLPTSTTCNVPTHQTRFQLENSGFVVHGCPIDKSWEESDLRNQVKEWFPILEENNIDVDFVKSCYGQIVTPKLAAGVKFTAARILSLSGQGSIYIRPREDIPNEDDAGSYSPGTSTVYSDNSDIDSSNLVSVNEEQGLPHDTPSSSLSTTKTATSHQENINKLQEMFPNVADDILGHALIVHGTVDKAALSLSANTNNPIVSVSDDEDEILQHATFLPTETTLNSILKILEGKLSNEKEKIRVEEEDLFNDAMCYYKDPNFDARKRIRVMYQGQPAVDTGGVTRQFFTNLLNIISDMFFEGNTYKSPIYNADVVASGMMKYIGTIIVHSVLQGGPGFTVFSPSVYQYLSTGDF